MSEQILSSDVDKMQNWIDTSLRGSSVVLRCFKCNDVFTRSKSELSKSLRRNQKIVCSKKCVRINQRNASLKDFKTIELICQNCHLLFNRSRIAYLNNINKNTETFFCSKKCSMTSLNRASKTSTSKSSHEVILKELIQKKYPEFDVIQNDRTVLPENLEIDIWIPSINLAIELNGPCHFYPIYGEHRLQQTRGNDIRKVLFAQLQNINLLVVDTSSLKSKSKLSVEKFINTQFESHICSAIDLLSK